MRAPRGQALVLLLFLSGALLGLLALGVGASRWSAGTTWAVLVIAGLLVGAGFYQWLKGAGYPQQP